MEFNDFLMLVWWLGVVGFGSLVCAIVHRSRRLKTLTRAARELARWREGLQVRRKTLLQQEAWHFGDPKTTFMREHLNRQIRLHNDIVDRINDEGRKL